MQDAVCTSKDKLHGANFMRQTHFSKERGTLA